MDGSFPALPKWTILWSKLEFGTDVEPEPEESVSSPRPVPGTGNKIKFGTKPEPFAHPKGAHC